MSQPRPDQPRYDLSRRELGDGAVLRPAVPADVPAIHRRIHDLAVYEREPDAVEGTAAMLHETLFAEDATVYCHVIDRDGEILGIALWFLNYSTWVGRRGIYLEDLFVSESERGKGYGVALMQELARICVERGYGRFEWSVLDWNEPSIRFYRRIGAVPMDGWTVQRLTGDALAAFAIAD